MSSDISNNLGYKKSNILYLHGISLDDFFNDEVEDQRYLEDISANDIISYSDFNEKPKTIYYTGLPDTFTSLEKWPAHTNLTCWYCDCSFRSIPVFIPNYISNNSNGELEIDRLGCFCSFTHAQEQIDILFSSDDSYNDKVHGLLLLHKIFTGKTVLKIPTGGPNKFIQKKYVGENGCTEAEYQKSVKDFEQDYSLSNFTIDTIDDV